MSNEIGNENIKEEPFVVNQKNLKNDMIHFKDDVLKDMKNIQKNISEKFEMTNNLIKDKLESLTKTNMENFMKTFLKENDLILLSSSSANLENDLNNINSDNLTNLTNSIDSSLLLLKSSDLSEKKINNNNKNGFNEINICYPFSEKVNKYVEEYYENFYN